MADTWDDDNPNAGTVNAPSQGSDTANVTSPDESSGGGQKPTKKDVPTDPLTTSRRRWNPLSKFSSYTYNISLYMLTPECANYVANNGVLPSNAADGEYFIIAQSGGINYEEPRALTVTSDLGPKKQGLDFYIDDLNIKVFMLTSDNQKTATAATTFSFKIIEPTGFTFLTKLSKACQQINKRSELIGNGDATAWPNLYQQHYLIGIRFYGYDENGALVESSNVPDAGHSFNKNDKFAVFERFFPIISSKVTTRLTGKATEYNFEGVYQNLQAAFGRKRGTIPANAEFKGSTVGEIIGNKENEKDDSLIAWLNKNQKKEFEDKKRNISQTYDVEWLDTDSIKKSSLLVDADYSKEISAMSIAKSVEQVNAKTSVVSNTVNTKQVIKGFSPDTPIVMAMDQIIVKSQYVVDTLIKKINDNIEGDTESETKGLLQWYAIHPYTEIIGRDKITKDWAYKTVYQIKQYPVPYLRSQYAPARSKYYGPVKQYSYWLTGENTEVISFEMSYDNSFYVVTSPSTNKDDAASKAKSSTTPTQTAGGTVSAPGSAQLNSGNAIAENVRANLYSPADQAIVNIKILGDPDFLMDTIGHKIQSDTFGKFYGKNDSINPYGGQVFIEIIFNLAEDYKDDGLLDVNPNETILFYPPEVQAKLGNKGVVYLINSVDSNFSRGKFEQTLELRMINPSELILPSVNENARRDIRSVDNAIDSQQTPEGPDERYTASDNRSAGVDPENLDPLEYMYNTDNTTLSSSSGQSDADPLIYTTNPNDDSSLPNTPNAYDYAEYNEEDVRENINRQSPVKETISGADAIRAVEESLIPQPPPGY